MNNTGLYEQDFFAWTRNQINLLKQGNTTDIDVIHLIEELEDMGKSHLSELESRFVILIAHLLKWQFQTDNQSSSWRGSINEQRVQIARLLRKNPSLKPKLLEAIIDAYPDSLEIACDETGLPTTHFPNHCSYTIEQLLDKQFFPMPNGEKNEP